MRKSAKVGISANCLGVLCQVRWHPKTRNMKWWFKTLPKFSNLDLFTKRYLDGSIWLMKIPPSWSEKYTVDGDVPEIQLITWDVVEKATYEVVQAFSRQQYHSIMFISQLCRVQALLHQIRLGIKNPVDLVRRPEIPTQVFLLEGLFQKPMISGSQSSTLQELGLRESYVSPRLLRGVVPSVLLENYSFWEGEETRFFF